MYQLQKTAHQLIVALAVGGFILDRFLKFFVQHLPLGKVVAFLPGLKFGYFLNPALFFFPAWRFIPYLALAVLILLTTYYVLRTTNSSPWLFILLGGASNVFDRFFYGGVVDYVGIFGVAAFNLSDVMIFTGLLILMCKSYDQRS